MTDPGEAFTFINNSEKIIKTQNKKTIGCVAKQGQILKKIRDREDFIKKVRLSRSSIFKIGLYKFFFKKASLKNLDIIIASC